MSQKEATPVFFSSPFSAEYWRSSVRELKNLRTLTLMALLIGLRVVLSAFFIPLGENLRIYFHFFISALGGYLCGPVLGLLSGFLADILGFLLFPSGAFFFGYTLSAMLVSFTFGLFLYHSRLSVLRIFVCKLVINLFINVGLGALWSAILYGKGYLFYLARSLGKNLLLLAPEVILTVFFFRIVLPILEGIKMVPPQPDGALALFSSKKQGRIPFRKSHIIQMAVGGILAGVTLCLAGIRYPSLPEHILVLNAPLPKITVLVYPLLAAVLLELTITLCLFLFKNNGTAKSEEKQTVRVQALRSRAFFAILLLIILLCALSLFHCWELNIPFWVAAILGLIILAGLADVFLRFRRYKKA